MSAPVGSSGQNNDTKKPQATSIQLGYFSNFPISLLLAAVVLYGLGWSYLYGYYSVFELSLHDLGFDERDMIVFAKNVVTLPVYCILLVVVVLIILFRNRHQRWQRQGSFPRWVEAGTRFFAWSENWRGLALTATLCVGVLLLGLASWLSFLKGRAEGESDMKEESSNLPMARLAIDKTKLPQSLFVDQISDGLLVGYRLLAHGRAGYYIFKAPKRDSQGLIGIVFIPDQAVLGAQLDVAIGDVGAAAKPR